ncbi:MAG: hypothetical protein ACRDKA_11455 [Actinomycetota bacterium]
MDPVTGFSRRALLALAGAVVVGIAAGTVATVIDAGTDDACPDPEYGCARFEPGEPVQVGALFPDDSEGLSGVSAAVRSRGTLLGRPLRVVPFDLSCSVRETAEAGREFATDPPDGPPVLAVITETCSAAEIPLAQILDDSGITLISTLHPAETPAPLPFYLAGVGSAAEIAEPIEPAAAAAAETVLDVVERVAVEHEGDLLVPRTQLRDGLLEAGLTPA